LINGPIKEENIKRKLPFYYIRPLSQHLSVSERLRSLYHNTSLKLTMGAAKNIVGLMKSPVKGKKGIMFIIAVHCSKNPFKK
jgi:hypothetical protein